MGIEYGERRSTFIDYGRPSLFLDFAKRKSLVDAISKNNLITFTRSSTGTYVGSDGLIKTAAADEARFDHNPDTLESLGLLIEESRTNLVTYSGEYNSSFWNILKTTPEPSNISLDSPDGGNDAWEYPIGASNRLQRNFATTVGQTYTLSFFAKQGNGSGIYSYSGILSDDRDPGGVIYDWNTDTLYSGWSKKDYANGWSRFYKSYTSITSDTFILRFDTGSGGVYFWGLQVEQGAFPTSYIPTSGSAVTRQPDNAQITGTNFTDWYNATEGTIFTEFSAKTNTTGYPGVYWFNNNLTVSRGFALVKETSPQTRVFQRGDDGVLKRVSFSENIPDSTFAKASVFYTNSEIGGSQNNAFQSPTSITSPYSVNRLYIGYHNSGGGVAPLHLNSHIKQLLYYPTRLTNTQLQALTQ